MRLLLALGVWVVAVVGAVAIGSAVETSTGGTGAGSSFSGTAGSSGTSGDFDASSVGAADSQSLFRKTNFPRALAAARARLGSNAQLNNFVLYPGYLSVSAATGSSELELYVDARGATRTVSAPRNPAGDTVFSLSGIGTNAPSALAHRISRRAHVPAAQLQYM